MKTRFVLRVGLVLAGFAVGLGAGLVVSDYTPDLSSPVCPNCRTKRLTLPVQNHAGALWKCGRCRLAWGPTFPPQPVP